MGSCSVFSAVVVNPGHFPFPKGTFIMSGDVFWLSLLVSCHPVWGQGCWQAPCSAQGSPAVNRAGSGTPARHQEGRLFSFPPRCEKPAAGVPGVSTGPCSAQSPGVVLVCVAVAPHSNVNTDCCFHHVPRITGVRGGASVACVSSRDADSPRPQLLGPPSGAFSVTPG